MGAHPDVEACAVIALRSSEDECRLVAYVVPRRPDLSASSLRSELGQWFVSASIPAVFALLQTLPLLPNGKIDYQALPPPTELLLGSENPFVAPRTEQEIAVATLWAELLGIERVSVVDNFFELGGDSLLAVRTLRGINALFRCELSVRALFDHPTVERLAAQLTDTRPRDYA